MMEFEFDASNVLPNVITVVDGHRFSATPPHTPPRLVKGSHASTSALPCRKEDENLAEIVNQIGAASAKAQALQTPITSATKLQDPECRLYIMREPSEHSGGTTTVIIGILKVGRKQLYLTDENGAFHKVRPLCLLDFYIHESKQRMGYGHALFEHMLKAESIEPVHLAVDRPSERCLQFLKKHYNLTTAIPQGNNFVIYPGFFSQFTGSSGDFVSRQENGTSLRSNSSALLKEEDDEALTRTPVGLDQSRNGVTEGYESCSSWKVMGIPPPCYMQTPISQSPRESNKQADCLKQSHVRRLW